MVAFSILKPLRSTARTFWIDQAAGSTAANHASNCTQSTAYHYADRTCNYSTDSCTRSHTCHQSAANQDGLRLPLGFLRIKTDLSCCVRVLGRNTMPRNGLLGKVWVSRFYARWLSGK